VTVAARVGRQTCWVATSTRLRGASTYAFSVSLPGKARAWTRLQVTVRFAGSTLVWPGAASLVLVRAR
jgi:hypothetical protein